MTEAKKYFAECLTGVFQYKLWVKGKDVELQVLKQPDEICGEGFVLAYGGINCISISHLALNLSTVYLHGVSHQDMGVVATYHNGYSKDYYNKVKTLLEKVAEKLNREYGMTSVATTWENRPQEIKADAGKIRMELIEPEMLEALGEVLTFGANKYEPRSWAKVDKERYIGAMLRHFVAYAKDPQSRDEDSGLLHIDHLFCNAAFLATMERREKDERI